MEYKITTVEFNYKEVITLDNNILHVDMDAFFASVEQRDNPDLRGKPVIVGGISERGVVSTCSYEARKYGVHSAMPIFMAKEKCPNGIFIGGRYGRYTKVSQDIFKILNDVTPLVEPVSIEKWNRGSKIYQNKGFQRNRSYNFSRDIL